MSPRSESLKRSQRRYTLAYILADFTAACIAYTWLYDYRKSVVEPARFGLESLEWDAFYPIGMAITALLWVGTMAIIGLYQGLLRKSRLTEVRRLIQALAVFVISYFLLFILDDYVKNYRAYWGSLQRFGGGLLLASVAFRLAIGGHIRWRIAQKHLHFATLVIGEKSIIEAHEAKVRKHADASGEVLAGWISTSDHKENAPCIGLPLLGTPKEIAHWASRLNIEDVVIALPPEEHYQLTPLLLDLEQLGLRIFMFPDTYGILSGMVRLDEHGVPLLEWHHEPMDSWQRNSKRMADFALSAAALLFLTPLLLLVAMLVASSKGPILYRQNRLGRQGKVFQIIKFRTMIAGAEAQGPQLSSTNDARITPIGSFLRKYRIDELPQFWNVLVGDMSLVGPRPEREFYASQIIERAPQYRHIYKVRPGITSWGMVRYGYASSVDEMIRRMEYDLLYIENMSWHNDFKVLIYTAWTVLKGRGK